MTTISQEQMDVYRATARKKAAKQKAEIDARYERAWETARRASGILKRHFGAETVLVFGSLLDRRLFHARSDIDLAAWGISEGDYLKAAGTILDLDPEFSADLVRMEEARDSLRSVIEHEGQII